MPSKRLKGLILAAALVLAALAWGFWPRAEPVETAVVADARRRGLTRLRYPAGLVAGLGASFVALFVAAIAVLAAADDEGDGQVAVWAVVLTFALVAVSFRALRHFDRTAQRDTPAGLAAATHWLSVREGYTSAGNYEVLPPAAVVLYERHLAYAAAMGVARTAIDRLPLGAEDPRHAWSHWGDRWRQVDVRYPRRRSGWGMSPTRAVVTGLLWTLALVVPFWVLARYGSDLYVTVRDGLRDLARQDDPGEPLVSDTVTGWVGAGIVAVVTAALLWLTGNAIRRGVLPLVRGITDAGRYRPVHGLVVRKRTFHRTQGERVIVERYLAVDDGTTDDLDAWLVPAALADPVDQGDEVRLEVTKRLGYVRVLQEVVKPPPPLPPPSIDELAPPPAPLPPTLPEAAPWWGDAPGA